MKYVRGAMSLFGQSSSNVQVEEASSKLPISSQDEAVSVPIKGDKSATSKPKNMQPRAQSSSWLGKLMRGLTLLGAANVVAGGTRESRHGINDGFSLQDFAPTATSFAPTSFPTPFPTSEPTFTPEQYGEERLYDDKLGSGSKVEYEGKHYTLYPRRLIEDDTAAFEKVYASVRTIDNMNGKLPLTFPILQSEIARMKALPNPPINPANGLLNITSLLDDYYSENGKLIIMDEENNQQTATDSPTPYNSSGGALKNDFSRTDFSCVNFANMNLMGMDISYSKFGEEMGVITLQNIEAVHADFSKSHFKTLDFVGGNSNFQNASFQSSQIDKMLFWPVPNFDKDAFKGTNFTGAEVRISPQIDAGHFVSLDLTGATLNGVPVTDPFLLQNEPKIFENNFVNLASIRSGPLEISLTSKDCAALTFDPNKPVYDYDPEAIASWKSIFETCISKFYDVTIKPNATTVYNICGYNATSSKSYVSQSSFTPVTSGHMVLGGFPPNALANSTVTGYNPLQGNKISFATVLLNNFLALTTGAQPSFHNVIRSSQHDYDSVPDGNKIESLRNLMPEDGTPECVGIIDHLALQRFGWNPNLNTTDRVIKLEPGLFKVERQVAPGQKLEVIYDEPDSANNVNITYKISGDSVVQNGVINLAAASTVMENGKVIGGVYIIDYYNGVFTPNTPPNTNVPSSYPSRVPSRLPSHAPSYFSSPAPSQMPSSAPSQMPSLAPSQMPSLEPSQMPSLEPSHGGEDVGENSDNTVAIAATVVGLAMAGLALTGCLINKYGCVINNRRNAQIGEIKEGDNDFHENPLIMETIVEMQGINPRGEGEPDPNQLDIQLVQEFDVDKVVEEKDASALSEAKSDVPPVASTGEGVDLPTPGISPQLNSDPQELSMSEIGSASRLKIVETRNKS